jgi:hypothetical protein
MDQNTPKPGTLTSLRNPYSLSFVASGAQIPFFASSYRSPPPGPGRPLLIISHLLSYLPGLGYSARDKEGLERTMQFFNKEAAYVNLQSTKPQTIGYSLNDSPVGLLSWIYEKIVGFTDAYPWEDDEILTWISIHYFSRSGPAAALNIYYEITNGDGQWYEIPLPKIPTGYSSFPREVVRFPSKCVYLLPTYSVLETHACRLVLAGS